MTGRDAEREQLAAALAVGRHYWDPEELRDIVADLLPVVDRIANEREAAALEAAADVFDAIQEAPAVGRLLRARAAALRASNGAGT